MTRKSTAIAVVLVSVLALAACKISVGSSSSSSSGPQTYSGNGVTFTYPAGWQSVTLTNPTASSASAPTWKQAYGISPTDFVEVAQYTLSASIDQNNINVAEGPTTTTVKGLFEQGGGSLNSGPTKGTMGGFPSLEYTGTVKTPDGTLVNSRLTLAFNGTVEYFVNCQYVDAKQADIGAGCDQVVGSFKTTA